MEKAFENISKIINLPTIKDKHREWLKKFEGLHFSIGENGKDLILWKQEMKKYVYKDCDFDKPILCLDGRYRANPNKIQRHPRIITIEYDDENAKKNLELTKEKLKKKILVIYVQPIQEDVIICGLSLPEI